jgi:organic radical activating enzyme
MPGSGVWETRPNPVEVDDLLALIDALDDPRGIHDAVSLTGGEPLLGADFINLLGPRLRDRGLDLYLETNGTLAEALSGIDPALPLTIAMDLKLAGATGQPTPWEDHRAFLDVARRRDPMATSLFAKAVVTPQVEVAEIAQAATVLAEAGDILLVIQPATPRPGGRFPTPTQLLDWHRAARGHLSTVRVIPQTHRILGQL